MTPRPADPRRPPPSVSSAVGPPSSPPATGHRGGRLQRVTAVRPPRPLSTPALHPQAEEAAGRKAESTSQPCGLAPSSWPGRATATGGTPGSLRRGGALPEGTPSPRLGRTRRRPLQGTHQRPVCTHTSPLPRRAHPSRQLPRRPPGRGDTPTPWTRGPGPLPRWGRISTRVLQAPRRTCAAGAPAHLSQGHKPAHVHTQASSSGAAKRPEELEPRGSRRRPPSPHQRSPGRRSPRRAAPCTGSPYSSAGSWRRCGPWASRTRRSPGAVGSTGPCGSRRSSSPTWPETARGGRRQSESPGRPGVAQPPRRGVPAAHPRNSAAPAQSALPTRRVNQPHIQGITEKTFPESSKQEKQNLLHSSNASHGTSVVPDTRSQSQRSDGRELRAQAAREAAPSCP